MSLEPAKRRREQSRADARRVILDATEALLVDEGYARFSIRKLVNRCGYTAPTIYHHFGDKRGLIDALLEERFRVVHELMAAIPRGPDAALHLREMARAFLRFALENPDHYRLLTMPRPETQPAVPSAEAARGLVKQALEELAREGTLATPDTEAAFQVTWAVLHGMISLQGLLPDLEFSSDLAELAFDTVESGLLRRKAATR